MCGDDVGARVWVCRVYVYYTRALEIMGVGGFAVTAWGSVSGAEGRYHGIYMEARRELFVKTVARFAEPYIVVQPPFLLRSSLSPGCAFVLYWSESPRAAVYVYMYINSVHHRDAAPVCVCASRIYPAGVPIPHSSSSHCRPSLHSVYLYTCVVRRPSVVSSWYILTTPPPPTAPDPIIIIIIIYEIYIYV